MTGVDQGSVSFGYTGQRTADVSTGIRTGDVAWLYESLGRITDDQLRDMLRASGATDGETEVFARTLRDRITQLGRACGAVTTAA